MQTTTAAAALGSSVHIVHVVLIMSDPFGFLIGARNP